MAREMGVTLTVDEQMAQIKISDLQFLQPLFCAQYNH